MRQTLINLMFLLVCCTNASLCQTRFGNEWIQPDQDYFRIPIAKTGIYKLPMALLQNAGWGRDIVTGRELQLFWRGKQVAIETSTSGRLSPDDFILFFGQKNDGGGDSVLYKSGTMPHSYYSLFSDTTSYFLTWEKGVNGKRIEEVKQQNAEVEADTHREQVLEIYNSFYSTGAFYPAGTSFNNGIALSTYDVGESWTGQSIAAGNSTDFSTTTSNISSTDRRATAEITIVGRSSTDHKIEIWAGPALNPKRKIGTLEWTGYGHQVYTVDLLENDIGSNSRLTISVKVITGETSVSAIQWRYPQNLGSLSLPQKAISPPNTKNTKQLIGNANHYRFYDCSDPYEIRRLRSDDKGVETDGSQLIWAVRTFLDAPRPEEIKLAIPPENTDYLIVSHKMLRKSESDPVEDYAGYRTSDQGGNYHTFIYNINQVYDQFGYGEAGPVAIRNLIRWFNQKGTLKFVFLIGASMDPQTARKSVLANANSLVPNGSWPGSDVLLATEDLQNPVPSVAIGRLNAKTSLEVSDYLQKVKDFEQQPRQAKWRKNILHLSGGRTVAEIITFRNYANGLERILKASSLAVDVTTWSKQTEEPIEQFPVFQPVNQGLSLLTVFGHSATNMTDIDIGFVSDSLIGYQNTTRYPAVIVNGCATGSIFYTPNTISSDWILNPKLGAIVFLAGTFNGASAALKNYTEAIYTVLADTAFSSKPFGTIIREGIRRNLQHHHLISDLAAAHQMTLHGDPAIVIFPAHLPDYQPIASGPAYRMLNRQNGTAHDSMEVSWSVENLGRLGSDSITVRIQRTIGNQKSDIWEQTIAPFNSAASVVVQTQIDHPARHEESWELSIDPYSLLKEESKGNNLASKSLWIGKEFPQPTFPPDEFVTNDTTLKLTAWYPDSTFSDKIVFEWAGTETFRTKTSSIAGRIRNIAQQEIHLPDTSKTWYWRIVSEDGTQISTMRSIRRSDQVSIMLPEGIPFMTTETIQLREGQSIPLHLNLQNISTTGFTDSVRIVLTHKSQSGSSIRSWQIASLQGFENRHLTLPELTAVAGTNEVIVAFNADSLPEEAYDNNRIRLDYNAIPDRIPPKVIVALDGRMIYQNDLVQPNPRLTVTITDDTRSAAADSSAVKIGLRKQCSGCGQVRIQPDHYSSSGQLLSVSAVLPSAEKGTYELSVSGRDHAGNWSVPYQIEYRLSTGLARLLEVGVYPNPGKDEYNFFFNLEGNDTPEFCNISIYDMTGCHQASLKKRPHTGRNTLTWRPGAIPIGLYFYRLSISSQSDTSKSQQQTGTFIHMP